MLQSSVRENRVHEQSKRKNGTPMTTVVTAPPKLIGLLRCLVEAPRGKSCRGRRRPRVQCSGIWRTRRRWKGQSGSGKVTIHHIGGALTIHVRVCEEDEREGLWLQPCGKTFSLKHKEERPGLYVMDVGTNHSPNRTSACTMAIISWIVRGKNWIDRNGDLHPEPCG